MPFLLFATLLVTDAYLQFGIISHRLPLPALKFLEQLPTTVASGPDMILEHMI